MALASVISLLPHTQSQSVVTLAHMCTPTQVNLHAHTSHTHTTMCIEILTHCTLINTCTDIFVSAH